MPLLYKYGKFRGYISLTFLKIAFGPQYNCKYHYVGKADFVTPGFIPVIKASPNFRVYR
jgi:hypothetical protein